MEEAKEMPQDEVSQIEEIKEMYPDFDLLGSNRGRSKSEKNEEPRMPPKRGDGGDLL